MKATSTLLRRRATAKRRVAVYLPRLFRYSVVMRCMSQILFLFSYYYLYRGIGMCPVPRAGDTPRLR